ncbi:hypothetical protein L0222_03185, partial [bacterium]|nr:hypothetical protein [bacterium]
MVFALIHFQICDLVVLGVKFYGKFFKGSSAIIALEDGFTVGSVHIIRVSRIEIGYWSRAGAVKTCWYIRASPVDSTILTEPNSIDFRRNVVLNAGPYIIRSVLSMAAALFSDAPSLEPYGET